MTARVLLALGATWLLLAGAVALCGCGSDEPRVRPASPAGEDETAPGDGNRAEVGGGARERVPADPGAGPRMETAADCGRCHRAIYEEWKASYHGRAMEDPLFREFSAEVNQEECIRCHAPVNLRDAGFETPVARSERREDAISCLSCHQVEGGVAGPSKGLVGRCRPVHDPDQRDVVKICFVCHNQHDTGNEWLRGPYSPEAPEPRLREARNCIDCHMPKVSRPLVPGGAVREGRRHTWYGGHSLAQLKSAAEVDVEVEPLPEGGHRFRVFVTNVGAGHSIPTDARHRSFDTYLLLRDAEGNVILDPTNPKDQARTHLAKFRKFYRGSGKKDTQIPPLERVDTLGEGPGFLDVPQARKGTGEAWLVYRLTPRDVLNKKSLEAPKDLHDIERLWRARVVLRKEFTYGE